MSGQQERKTPEGNSYKDLVLTVTSIRYKVGVDDILKVFLFFLICAKREIFFKMSNLHFHKLKDTSDLICLLYYACYLLND